MMRLLLVALIGAFCDSLFLTGLVMAESFNGSVPHIILLTPLFSPVGAAIGFLPALLVTVTMSRAIRHTDNRVRHIGLWLVLGGTIAALPFALSTSTSGSLFSAVLAITAGMISVSPSHYDSSSVFGLVLPAMAGMIGTFAIAKLLSRP